MTLSDPVHAAPSHDVTLITSLLCSQPCPSVCVTCSCGRTHFLADNEYDRHVFELRAKKRPGWVIARQAPLLARTVNDQLYVQGCHCAWEERLAHLFWEERALFASFIREKAASLQEESSTALLLIRDL